MSLDEYGDSDMPSTATTRAGRPQSPRRCQGEPHSRFSTKPYTNDKGYGRKEERSRICEGIKIASTVLHEQSPTRYDHINKSHHDSALPTTSTVPSRPPRQRRPLRLDDDRAHAGTPSTPRRATTEDTGTGRRQTLKSTGTAATTAEKAHHAPIPVLLHQFYEQPAYS
ncbi:hypothetical protein AVEN_170916-1 [Araneus ventricosus]|uniref:Uncharacterized protein n=1 Tax=Araneus ventricosus TaxID=182803 RepID=A0A4Y2JC85_ARAVE|nr:hypothetical protein AVEN_170916-1 [Araneus ventricosus]